MRLSWKERRVSRRGRLVGAGWPCWALACGFLVGLATYAFAMRAEERRLESRLEEHASERAGALERELGRELGLLHALRAFFQSSHEVEPEEFSIFARELLREATAVRALGWAPRSVDGRCFLTYEETRGEEESGLAHAFSTDDASGSATPDGTGSAHVVVTTTVGGEAAATALLALRDPWGEFAGWLVARLDLARLTAAVLGAERTAHDRADFSVTTTSAEGPVEVRPRPRGTPAHVAGATHEFLLGGQLWSLHAWPNDAFLARHGSSRGLLVAILAGLLWTAAHLTFLARARISRARAARLHAVTLSSILQSLEEGVLVCDSKGRVLFKNESIDRLIGTVEDTPLAAWPRRYGLHADQGEPELPPERLPLARALRGERVPLERLWVQRPGRRGAWLSASAVPLGVRRARDRNAILVLRDISRQLEADATIRKLSSAVEQTADMVFITDARGRLVYGNAAFARRVGCGRDELAGRDLREFWSVRSSPPLAHTWVDGVEHALGRQQIWTSPAGEELTLEEAITPIRDAAGAITAWVSVCHDLADRRERRRLADELGLASLVQARLYPRTPPAIPGLDLAGACFPAKETCGDYFDFLELLDGRLVVLVGDISGHGLGPALLMAEVRAYLRALFPAKNVPADRHAERAGEELARRPARDVATAALRALNHLVERDFADGVFLTVIVAVIDPVTRVMDYASAGHEPVIVLRADGALKRLAESTGVAVGLMPDLEIRPGAPVQLEVGDTILFTTDGLSELHDDRGQVFGQERVLRLLQERRGQPSAEIVEGLRRIALDFHASGSFEDDVTIVCCRVTNEPRRDGRAARARVATVRPSAPRQAYDENPAPLRTLLAAGPMVPRREPD